MGKELIAHPIHFNSKRRDKPFITVNCGAIPEGLIESELFGHVRGSFTDAVETRKGYFEAASGGTIFLDEIGELPLATQVKFLRVIEAGEYIKVGGTKTEKVDVRIIAATNKSLESLITNNSFRVDLYCRLRSININIPPLRERKEDIGLLFDYFSDVFCNRNNISFMGISDDAIEFITNYNWPGNVRKWHVSSSSSGYTPETNGWPSASSPLRCQLITSSVTGSRRRWRQSEHLTRGFSLRPLTHSLAQAG